MVRRGDRHNLHGGITHQRPPVCCPPFKSKLLCLRLGPFSVHVAQYPKFWPQDIAKHTGDRIETDGVRFAHESSSDESNANGSHKSRQLKMIQTRMEGCLINVYGDNKASRQPLVHFLFPFSFPIHS